MPGATGSVVHSPSVGRNRQKLLQSIAPDL